SSVPWMKSTPGLPRRCERPGNGRSAIAGHLRGSSEFSIHLRASGNAKPARSKTNARPSAIQGSSVEAIDGRRNHRSRGSDMKQELRIARPCMIGIVLIVGGLAAKASAQVCSPMPADLLAWYRGEGNQEDSSGHGLNGRLPYAASTPPGYAPVMVG